jgi:superfamily I DNA and/or RNA helicase
MGLNITLLERCVKEQAKVQLLTVQYRMHQTIMGFPNAEFYDNQLQAADAVANWCLQLETGPDNKPVELIDTAGCGFEEKMNPESMSYYNPEEYYILRQHLDRLLTYAGEHPPSIGILSPYREQVVFMQEQLATDFDHFPNAPITVDTIDAFQGQERDVMYISMVRSNDKGEIGFLKDTRRMNVAMTRARKKLVIIGDSATLSHFDFYQRFLTYCESVDGYGSAWEWM